MPLPILDRQAERLGLQLADALISPTRYMTAFLRQRGWRLPKTALVIPNVAPPRLDPQQALPQAPGGGPQASGLVPQLACLAHLLCPAPSPTRQLRERLSIQPAFQLISGLLPGMDTHCSRVWSR